LFPDRISVPAPDFIRLRVPDELIIEPENVESVRFSTVTVDVSMPLSVPEPVRDRAWKLR
jgi:hypothetical protein